MKLPPRLPRPPATGLNRAWRSIMILSLCALVACLEIGSEFPNAQVSLPVDARPMDQSNFAMEQSMNRKMLVESSPVAAAELASHEMIAATGKHPASR